MKALSISFLLSCGLIVSPSFAQEQKPPPDPSKVKKMLEDDKAFREDAMSIRMQLMKCWKPSTTKEVFSINVFLKLKPNGMLDGKPEVTTKHNDKFSRALASAATKAIYDCQPLKGSPSTYERWKELTLVFENRP